MNDARFTGNLTKDPEMKELSSGKKRAMFTLAVQRRYVNHQTGVREADFITFYAYDRNAEMAEKYLTKGKKILVESHVKTGKYEKDGQTIYTTEFVVDAIEFVTPAQASDHSKPAQAEEQPTTMQEAEDDELPF